MDVVTLAAGVAGQGSPLVILHGLFGSHRNWGSVSRALTETASPPLQVHALDLRNHGDSPWHPRMGYDDMAADVAHYILQNHLAPVTLLGHSMGGKTAMRLAALRPALISRLIIVDIAPAPYRHDQNSGFVRALQQLPLASLTRRAEADSLLQPAIQDDMLRAFLLQNLVSDAGGFRWRLNLADIGANMPDLIGFPADGSAFTGPTSFLAGERSDYIRPRDREAIMSLFPAAQLFELADCGHWPHAEQPALFLARLRALLDA
jgi:pimeloyl-ACP methyl ester carboxylesterase